jgi:hypothetical protein
MTIHIRIRVPGTGEHIDDGTEVWDGTPLDQVELSAHDLGCEPGTVYTLERVDYEHDRVIDSLDTVAT